MTQQGAFVHLSSAEGIQKEFHRFIFVLKGKWKETMPGQQDVQCEVTVWGRGIYRGDPTTAAEMVVLWRNGCENQENKTVN